MVEGDLRLACWGILPEAPAREAAARLAGELPGLWQSLCRGLADLGAALTREARRDAVPDTAFCSRFAPHVRPLAGFFERVLQNGDGSRAARLRCLSLLERVASLTATA